MDILFVFLLIAIWLYVFWAIGQILMSWKAKRDYHKQLHPKKRREWPFKRAVRHEEAKRRASYRPPNRER